MRCYNFSMKFLLCPFLFLLWKFQKLSWLYFSGCSASTGFILPLWMIDSICQSYVNSVALLCWSYFTFVGILLHWINKLHSIRSFYLVVYVNRKKFSIGETVGQRVGRIIFHPFVLVRLTSYFFQETIWFLTAVWVFCFLEWKLRSIVAVLCVNFVFLSPPLALGNEDRHSPIKAPIWDALNTWMSALYSYNFVLDVV